MLIASIDECIEPEDFPLPGSTAIVRLVYGDYSVELTQLCSSLRKASDYTSNDKQKTYLEQLMRSFESGSLDRYRAALCTWIEDKSPHVENIFGFVEPYRDPYGVRAEFEGLVAINDPKETEILRRLVEGSDTFIRRLPWARRQRNDNDGKGPFEKKLFEPPDFTSISGI